MIEILTTEYIRYCMNYKFLELAQGVGKGECVHDGTGSARHCTRDCAQGGGGQVPEIDAQVHMPMQKLKVSRLYRLCRCKLTQEGGSARAIYTPRSRGRSGKLRN